MGQMPLWWDKIGKICDDIDREKSGNENKQGDEPEIGATHVYPQFH